MACQSTILTDTLILSLRRLQMLLPLPPCWLQYLPRAVCQYDYVHGRLISPFDFLVHTYGNKPGGEMVVLKSSNSPEVTGPRKAVPVVALTAT